MQHPQRIGPYQIEEFLGGGMCHVYRAQDPVLDKTVAIKILTPENSQDPDAKARFLREARMAASLSHQNCLTVYSFGEEQGSPYMVMEFLHGENLGSAIKNGRTGNLGNKLRIALEIARVLEYIGSKGIVHRDVKPDNIHIDDSGVVKLIDFGIAKKPVDLSLTHAGLTMGTAPYMAPEQVLGKDISHLVDVYAFGLLLFELLTGQRAIPPSDDVARIFYQILKEPLDLAPLKTANIPQGICEIVRRCTEKAPADRPQNFEDVGREIQRVIRETESGPERKERKDGSPIPGSKWILGAVGVLALVLVGAFVFWRTRPVPNVVLPPTIRTDTGEMVLVPGDTYLKRVVSDPMPSFYVDRTEVTNAAFQAYCKTLDAKRPLACESSAVQPDYPVVNVTIDEAKAFASWAGKRLPTLKEWERAALGVDGRAFPWGAEHDVSRANVNDNPASKSALVPADSFPLGDSPYGARQMAGNVWEWIDKKQQATPDDVKGFEGSRVLDPPPLLSEDWYIMMGGSWDQKMLSGLREANLSVVPGRLRINSIGFRCVKDVDPATGR